MKLKNNVFYSFLASKNQNIKRDSTIFFLFSFLYFLFNAFSSMPLWCHFFDASSLMSLLWCLFFDASSSMPLLRCLLFSAPLWLPLQWFCYVYIFSDSQHTVLCLVDLKICRYVHYYVRKNLQCIGSAVRNICTIRNYAWI